MCVCVNQPPPTDREDIISHAFYVTFQAASATLARRIQHSENNIEIAKILPHRYPFLLVDKVIHLEKMKRAVGIKSLGDDVKNMVGRVWGEEEIL